MLIIRREGRGDHEDVRALHDLAFDGLYGNTPGAGTVEAHLLDDLRADAGWIPELSLVAVDDGTLVGHVVCTRATLGDGAPALGLGPIGVARSVRGRGTGTALMHAVCAAAEALGEAVVVLLGDPDFYRRVGFVLAGDLGITPPDPAWAPNFQARPLAGFDPAVHRGAFTYAQPFQDLD